MFKWSKIEADYVVNIIVSFILMFMFIGQGIYVIKSLKKLYVYR
jgi:hypothetical protein